MTPKQVLQLYRPHDYTIPSLIDSRASAAPSKDAVCFEARCWNYADLVAGSVLLAKLLSMQGVAKGDRVAHVAPNSDLTVLLLLAAARLGAVFTPMNVELSDDDLDYMLGHSQAKIVFARGVDAERLSGILARRAQSAPVLALETLGSEDSSTATTIHALRKLTAAVPQVAETPIDAEAHVLIIYTSGTTGFPKAVLHTHRTYILAGEAFVLRLHLQPDDRLLSVFPMFHGNALFYSVGGALAAGATTITAARFSASKFWDLAVESRATQLNILAALGNILMLRPRSEYRPEHQIRKIYGGPISAEMYRVFQDEFNVPTMIEGYGMSEIPAVCSNPFEGPYKVGSIGVPNRHPLIEGAFTQVEIQDDDGHALPVGEIGELTVRTPTVFVGYLNDPEQTQAVFRKGWFLTGDLARIDEDGYVHFIARKKDIIRRRGENISGAELDRVLGTHPDLAEAASIAVPAELGDDEILMVLVPKEGRQPDCAQILAWCREHLAPIKVPRFLVIADELPHTPSHRVAKHVLKQDAAGLRARAFDAEATRAAA